MLKILPVDVIRTILGLSVILYCKRLDTQLQRHLSIFLLSKLNICFPCAERIILDTVKMLNMDFIFFKNYFITYFSINNVITITHNI